MLRPWQCPTGTKTLIFLFIPLFAVLFYALFFKKRKFLVEHIVVGTHFWSFILLIIGVVLPLATMALLELFRALNIHALYVTNDGTVSSFLQIYFAVYLFMMLRRCYGISNWYGVLTASVIVAVTFLSF